MCTHSSRKRHRLRADRQWLSSIISLSVWSNGSFSTLILAFILIVVTALGSCSNDRHVDPQEVSQASDGVRLRYSYAVGTEFTYRQNIERTHYGTSSGETHLLQLRCRESSHDIHSFSLVDSLLFTHSGTTQFTAGQRTFGSFKMTSSGDLPNVGNALMAAALPLVPLPGLPDDELSLNETSQQEFPYGHSFPKNTHVIRSTRESRLTNSPESNGAILHEEIVQVVEREHTIAGDTTSLVHPVARTFAVTYDTLAITREIELSGITGHLVRSIETEREVQFIPDGTGSSADGLPRGSYAVNESVTRFTLVAMTEPQK